MAGSSGWVLFVSAGAAFAAAQVGQGLIERRLKTGETSTLFDVLPIVHADNRGATLGLLATRGSILLALNVAAAAVLLLWVARAGLRHPLLAVAVGLITGGGAANLVDRLVSAHITDYFKLPYAPAVFNLADVFIVAGGLMLMNSLASRERSRIDR